MRKDFLHAARRLWQSPVFSLTAILTIALGIGAAYVVAAFLLGINPADTWHQMVRHTDDIDMLTGLVKTFVFGGIIAVVACYKGMTCPQGAEGVGHATTEAVVYSSIAVLISNFFLTMLLNTLLR